MFIEKRTISVVFTTEPSAILIRKGGVVSFGRERKYSFEFKNVELITVIEAPLSITTSNFLPPGKVPVTVFASLSLMLHTSPSPLLNP
jgi:hypothetical protein